MAGSWETSWLSPAGPPSCTALSRVRLSIEAPMSACSVRLGGSPMRPVNQLSLGRTRWSDHDHHHGQRCYESRTQEFDHAAPFGRSAKLSSSLIARSSPSISAGDRELPAPLETPHADCRVGGWRPL